MFGNTTLYLFMRLFNVLYSRLAEIKSYESVVHKDVANAHSTQFARDLQLYDTKLEDMGLAYDANSSCYEQTLDLCYRLLGEEIEPQWFEEALRQGYRNRAYKLYTVDKVTQSLLKQVHTLVTDQASVAMLVAWQQDRLEKETDLKHQIAYRMRVKQAIGVEESMFRISWDVNSHNLNFQSLGTYELTLKGLNSAQQKWEYYVTSYMLSVPTEGVPLDAIRKPLLQRSLPADIPDDYPFTVVAQNLQARIAFETYRLFFEPGTADYIAHLSQRDSGKVQEAHEERKKRWSEVLAQAETALRERESESIAETKPQDHQDLKSEDHARNGSEEAQDASGQPENPTQSTREEEADDAEPMEMN